MPVRCGIAPMTMEELEIFKSQLLSYFVLIRGCAYPVAGSQKDIHFRAVDQRHKTPQLHQSA